MKMKIKKIERYLQILEEASWINQRDVTGIVTVPCGYKTDNTIPALSEMTPFKVGDVWGSGNDTHAWFRFTVTPEAPNTYLRVTTGNLEWDPQFLLYINGETVQGFDRNHDVCPLETGKTADVAIYAYTGMNTPSIKLFVHLCEQVPQVYGLYYDIFYPFEMLKYLNEESPEYARVVDYLWRAVSMLELYEIGSAEFLASVSEAREFMKTEFYGNYCSYQPYTTVGIGHTHIDCAWLWTLDQTREKVQRSFSTVLSLMKQYPKYKFMSSQAFLYQNLKEEAPALYEQVKERVRQGRWEVEGAMWVEADCNICSGESLVRQVLYGKNYFREEFGVENRVLWLPDVFGYSAALPQILKKSGVDWFVTSKISWNDTDRMPYDTFYWRGIDGTEVNTQFLTAQNETRDKTYTNCTYNGNTGAPMVDGTYRRYSQKNLNDEALLTFGFGDGGGGPNPSMLELAARAEKGIPGCANMKIEFAGDFLHRLEKKLKTRTDVPTWQGELYLEFHRGTYTTMSHNKRENRQSEFLYQNAELLSTIGAHLLGEAFPQAELHKGWEMILTNQFHDIIPGSSIREVYERSARDYVEIKRIGSSIADSMKQKIAGGIAKDRGYVVFNPHSFATEGFVKINGKTVLTKEKIAPKGYLTTNAFCEENGVSIVGNTVETALLRVVFDEHWQITSIYDKKNAREVLKAGAIGNELRAHADYPTVYDAWEWQEHSLEEYRSITAVSSVEIVDDGVRKGIRIVRPYMHSLITQTVWFCDTLCRIDFETVADWHEHHQMLKAAFPVDINTDKATYEIQFGSVERPTHKNTSWDVARFEVCAHKYADISEGDYGVAMINDCKYGHDIHDGVMQLSLLRSPTSPHPEADQGEIKMTYAIIPHAHTLAQTDVVKQAYYLNDPMTAIKAMGESDILPASFSLLSVDAENVICETVKQAENDNGTVIRLYECKNFRTVANITFGIPVKKLMLCDLMERQTEEIPVVNGKATVPFKGFEIITLKVL